MAIKLDTFKIFELASHVDKTLVANGAVRGGELVVYVSGEELRKIDEDLFYRNNEKDDEFVPSEGEVYVTCNKLKIIFKDGGEENT